MSTTSNITPIIQASPIEISSKNFIEDNYDADLFSNKAYADFNTLRTYPLGTEAQSIEEEPIIIDSPAKIEDTNLRLFSDEDIESNFIELPSYLISSAFNSLQSYAYYPLDSNLEGLSKNNVNTRVAFARKNIIDTGSTTEIYSNLTRDYSVIDLASKDHQVTDFINDPVFTPEGLSTYSSDANLLTGDYTSAASPHLYGFKLTNISKLKSQVEPTLVNLVRQSLSDVSYHQNYALSDECFAVDCKTASYTGSFSITTPSFEAIKDVDYTFSFYAKLHDRSASDTLNGFSVDLCLDSNNLKVRNIPYSISSNIISKNWTRYYLTFKPNPATSSATYNLKLNLNITDSSDTVLVAGVLLEKDLLYPTTYDSRKHSLDYEKVYKFKEHTYIALLPLDNISGLNIADDKKSWLISYRRLVIDNHPCLDSLGANFSFGYDFNKEINSLTAKFGGSEISDVKVSEYINNWEQVFIYKIYDQELDVQKLHYKVTSLVTGNSYTAESDYEGFNPIYLCNANACNPGLQLGSTGAINATGRSGTTLKCYKGLYRDLIFVPVENNIEVKDIISAIENSFISIRDYSLEDNKNLVALQASRISEVL